MKRIGGRPRLDAGSPTAQVTVYLSVKQLDDLCREAHHARVSVPELIRRKIDGRPVNKLETRQG
jgi:hypothetical protein